MVKPAINVEGLWKEYTVGAQQQQHGTFYELLTHALKAPLNRLQNLGGAASEAERFWALRNLSFKVEPGEVVGIIGRNGAGKSTLLKILSRITAPTRGRITVHGRIASLLEVGTGFHPELTGRENIYLNATILGMGRREIDRKFDAIVGFSGVEKFLDTPVKRYSSGMYVRLAFAVAAHVEADILLIDEVLAVGDAEFQKRCLGMMGDVARAGRAVLFVSHNLTALRNLCTTGLLLHNGQSEARGEISDVLRHYSSNSAASAKSMTVLPQEKHASKPASILQISLAPQQQDEEESSISVESGFSIQIQVEIREADTEIGVFLSCFDSNQTRVFSTGSFFDPRLNGVKLPKGTYAYICEVPADLLNEGDFTLDVSLIRNRAEVVFMEPAVLSFRITAPRSAISGWNWPVLGVVRPRLMWSQQAIAVSSPC